MCKIESRMVYRAVNQWWPVGSFPRNEIVVDVALEIRIKPPVFSLPATQVGNEIMKCEKTTLSRAAYVSGSEGFLSRNLLRWLIKFLIYRSRFFFLSCRASRYKYYITLMCWCSANIFVCLFVLTTTKKQVTFLLAQWICKQATKRFCPLASQ